MTPADLPFRYLTSDDVRASMPPLDEQLRLAELTMTALGTPGAAQLPAKIAIHPRPEGSFAHAMPAHLRAAPNGDSPERDLVGMKWVAGFRGNTAIGLDKISALVILNDPATGQPIALLDGRSITAQRTAAVSGVAIRHFAPPVDGRAPTAAILGAGVQGRSHLAVLGHVLDGVELRIFDRHPERAEALATLATSTPGIATASAAPSARDAVAGAGVVVSVTAFTTPDRRQAMTSDWLGPQALVVAVDYATMCSAEVARGADVFLVDELGQFLANREAGQFEGYPDPTAMLGEAILAGMPRPAGRVVVTHLGVGLADVVFGSAILERATLAGLGQVLPR